MGKGEKEKCSWFAVVKVKYETAKKVGNQAEKTRKTQRDLLLKEWPHTILKKRQP